MLLALVDRADVLVENFRTGVLERLGLGIESLQERNPRLVVLSITGFGHDGPEGGRAGYDQIAQGEAGLMSLTGSGPDDPQRVGVPIADLLAGMYGAYGVRRRAARAGPHRRRARVVRTSLLAAIVGVHAFQGTRWTVAGEVGRAQGNHHPSIAPYGLFHCRDGSVQIAVGSEGLWQRFCAGFDLDPAADGLATNAERVANRERVIELVEAAFADWDAEPLLARLAEVGVPGRARCARSTRSTPGTRPRARACSIDVEHPTLGPLTLPGPPLRFFDADGDRGDPPRPRGAARPSTSTARAIRAWLQERVMAPDRWTAHELLDLVLDDGSFESWDEPIDISGQLRGLPRRAASAAAERAGTDESVLTGRGLVRGRPVAVVVNEFALPRRLDRPGRRRRIIAARAPRDRRGAAPARDHRLRRHPDAGGDAGLRRDGRRSRGRVMAHRAAGLPYLVHLRHPTTGGVYASWGSLGHVTVAEPGALVGFLGPKVYEALNGAPVPGRRAARPRTSPSRA